MATSTYTRNAESNQRETPSAIIDKAGKIIALNADLKKIAPAATAQANLFELFDEETLLTLQRIFIETRKYETVSKDSVTVKINSVDTIFTVSVSPLRSENNIYFIVNFAAAEESGQKSENQKFWIAASDIEKISDNKKIASIIQKIKLTFPFTFIEKAKIQKEINELEEYFWLKDISSKYLLVNDKYAESLGFRASQIENKNEEDLLPKYLTSLYRMVDSYIISSTNSVIIDSLFSPITAGSVKDLSLVQFPLCDLDNNVVAIIGFSKRNIPFHAKGETEGGYDNFYRELPIPAVLIGDDLKIKSCSRELVSLLNLDSTADWKGRDLSLLLEKKLILLVEEYIRKSEIKESSVFNYIFIEKQNLNTEITLQKIFDDQNKLSALQIHLTPKIEFDSETSAKSKMYDALIQYSPEAMFIYDIENLKFLEVNEVALKLYGYKRSDFLNMDLTDLYAPEDIQTIIEAGESKSNAGNYSGPWRHKKSDGSSILVELSRTSIEFSNKKSHLNIVRNVSEQAEQKRKIQLLESAFENTSDPILNTDKDGFITEINDQVTKKLGYSKKDLENRPFITLVADDDRAKVNKKVFHSGILKTTSLEIEFKKQSGDLQPADLVATPIKNYNGEVESFSLIVKTNEVTAKKNENKDQLEIAQKVDPQFLSNVFHEILTPINVILGFTKEIEESIHSPNEEQKEAIDIIKENQKLLLQIMDNAVEYSTLEQKIIKFRPEYFKLSDIIEDIKENTRKAVEDKKVTIDFASVPSDIAIETDKAKLSSLLSLFLKFAIQITKENSLYLSVSNYDADSVAVKIKDNSNLITPFLLRAMIDIFSADESMSRRNYGFSRFSVKLAKKLIEILSVKKETINRGGEPEEFALVLPSKFISGKKESIELDVQTADRKPEIKSSQKLADRIPHDHTEKNEKDSKSIDLTQLSCLYLEDQLDSQMLFKVQFKDLKSIEFAQSFESALPLLKTKKFDFIVIDINLQGEYNGLDAMRIIQKMPGLKDIPIIASTAYVQPGARDNFVAAGFTEFVSKPLLREKLLEVLKTLF